MSYKRPESILVLVVTRGGEVLMMERTRPHGFWQSVTGSLRWGESAAAAAARELTEETGLRNPHPVDLRQSVRFPIVPPWRARYAPEARFNHEHWFLLILPARRIIRLNRTEHRQYRWMPAAQALNRASSWTNRKLIRDWMSRHLPLIGDSPADTGHCGRLSYPSYNDRTDHNNHRSDENV